MTREEFLAELAKTPREWTVSEHGWLRCGKGDCPITSVYRLRDPNHKYDPSYYGFLGQRLGLYLYERGEIATAADGHGLPKLRADLLKACGLA